MTSHQNNSLREWLKKQPLRHPSTEEMSRWKLRGATENYIVTQPAFRLDTDHAATAWVKRQVGLSSSRLPQKIPVLNPAEYRLVIDPQHGWNRLLLIDKAVLLRHEISESWLHNAVAQFPRSVADQLQQMGRCA